MITTKASILECAVKSLQRLQNLCNSLMQSNKQLQKENKRLRMELSKYSPSFSFSGEDGSPSEDFVASMPMLPVPGFHDLAQVDGLLDNSQFPTMDYPSSSSSPLNYSPDENEISSSYEEDDYYRFNKRRMLVNIYHLLSYCIGLGKEELFCLIGQSVRMFSQPMNPHQTVCKPTHAYCRHNKVPNQTSNIKIR